MAKREVHVDEELHVQARVTVVHPHVLQRAPLRIAALLSFTREGRHPRKVAQKLLQGCEFNVVEYMIANVYVRVGRVGSGDVRFKRNTTGAG